MDFSNVTKFEIEGKEVTQLTINNQIFWQRQAPREVNYFYIENISNVGNVISYNSQGTTNTPPSYILYYSLDKNDWKEIHANSTNVTLQPNQRMYIKKCRDYETSKTVRMINFVSTDKINVGGDLTTIISEYGGVKDLSSILTREFNIFSGIFQNSKIVNAKELILPSTTLFPRCYYNFFKNSKFLISCPELPALNLADNCYDSFYDGCVNLQKGSDLPATKMKNSCYRYMYASTGLIDGIDLPALELADYCYEGFYDKCEKLRKGSRLPATVLKKYCYQHMYNGCVNLLEGSDLPALNLVEGCYAFMYYNAKKMNKLKAMYLTDPNREENFGNTRDMLEGCSVEGTFYKNYQATWENTNGSHSTNGWNVVLWDYENNREYIPPFYIENISDKENEIAISGIPTSEQPNCTFEYSLDGKQWQLWGSTHDPMTSEAFPRYKDGINIKLQPHQKMYLRGENQSLSSEYDANGFLTQYEVNIGGDLTSLISKEGNVLDLTGRPYTFGSLFALAKVVNADSLILPSTTLSKLCYGGLFCPLANELTTLTSANFELPAEILTESCYQAMMRNSQITKAPTIKAKEIGLNSLKLMFSDCPNLNEVSIEFTKWNATDAEDWLLNVNATGNINKPKNLNMPKGDNGIPFNWSINGKYDLFYVEDASGENNQLEIRKSGTYAPVINLEYSNDGQNWKVWENMYNNPLPLPANSKIFLRGENRRFAVNTDNNYNSIKCTSAYNVGGDLTYLLSKNGGVMNLGGRDFTFCNLFEYGLRSAENLILPSIYLSYYCYSHLMPQGLQKSFKVLPAETLSMGCYKEMISWNAMPMMAKICAKNGEANSMQYMLSNCSEITDVEILINQLSGNEFQNMLGNCYNLRNINLPNLKEWRPYASTDWLKNSNNNGSITAPHIIAGTADNQIELCSVSGVPFGWTFNGNKQSKNFLIKNVNGYNDLHITLEKYGNWYGDLYVSKDGINYEYRNNITIPKKEYLYVRVNDSLYQNSADCYCTIKGDTDFEVMGDLYTYQGSSASETSHNSYGYFRLFKGNQYLKAVRSLQVDIRGYEKECSEMFADCPKLSYVEIYVYQSARWDERMFENWLMNAGTSSWENKEIRAPYELQIPNESNNGCPSGWTQYDYK